MFKWLLAIFKFFSNSKEKVESTVKNTLDNSDKSKKSDYELTDVSMVEKPFDEFKTKEDPMGSWWYFNNGRPEFKEFDWKYIVLHHSKSKDKEETAQMGDLRKWHMEENGWNYIGYHFVLEMVNGHWEIIMARPLNMNGAHESKRNYDGIGICVIGDFTNEEMPVEAQQKLAVLVKSLQMNNDIDDDHVTMHRDWTDSKDCPGDAFVLDDWKSDYLDEVA